MANWTKDLNDKIEEVHDLMVEAEAIIMGMDVNDTDYAEMKAKYDEANWSFVVVEHDPSGGAHNFEYEMELLEHAEDLFQDIIDTTSAGGIISGKVTDATTGDPIMGANVTVGLIFSVTNAAGEYQLSGVTPGTGLNVTVSDVMFGDSIRYDGTFNASVDLTDSVTVNFALMEHALPVTVTPAADATDVAVDTTITVKFEEGVNMTSLDITVMAGTTAVTGTVTLDNSTNTATFTPDADLAEGTEYKVTVADTVMGTDDDPILWKDKEWSFTTMSSFSVTAKAEVGGVATAIPSGQTLTGVDTDTTIMVTFPVDVNSSSISITVSGSVTGTVTYDAASKTATFTPDSALSENTEYTITLGTGLMDAAGNSPIDTAMTWTFRTIVPPSFSLDLGPILDEDDEPVEGAKVTVTIDGTDYTGTTDANGEVSIPLTSQPAAGTYTVKVTKDDFDDLEYDITVDDNGEETQGTIPKMKATEESSNTLLLILVIVIIIVILLVVVMAMRKKPSEEAPEEEGEEAGEAGEFECPACGAVVSDAEGACPECGEEFEEEAFKCPECAAELEPDASSCTECGAEFEEIDEEGEEEGEEEEYEVEDDDAEEDEEGDELDEEDEEDEELLEGEEMEESDEELDSDESEELLDEEGDEELEDDSDEDFLEDEEED
jgi:hypothetical protein